MYESLVQVLIGLNIYYYYEMEHLHNPIEKKKEKVQYPVRVTNEQVVEITSSFSVNIIKVPAARGPC